MPKTTIVSPDPIAPINQTAHVMSVRIRQVAADGGRSGLHDQLFRALGCHVEMAFELYGAQVRVRWRGGVQQRGELQHQGDHDGDGDGEDEHVDASRSGEVDRCRLR